MHAIMTINRIPISVPRADTRVVATMPAVKAMVAVDAMVVDTMPAVGAMVAVDATVVDKLTP